MRAVKGKGTRLERRIFGLLAQMKLGGWKKNFEGLAGKPDVAFIERQVAFFIDGCFWHGCPYCRRTLPVTNRAYWQRKIQRNVALARAHNRRLRRDGWRVVRIWEHEIADTAKLKARILSALREEKQRGKS